MLVKANVPGGDKYAKIAEIQKWLDSQSWPDGISFRFLGAGDEENLGHRKKKASSRCHTTRRIETHNIVIFVMSHTQFQYAGQKKAEQAGCSPGPPIFKTLFPMLYETL